jgi:uncharacterized protein with NRDE domain
MCTLSVIRPTPLSLRLAFNRDESRNRQASLPVRKSEHASHQALMPIDAAAGGTWIAVNSFGVVFALLNHNAIPPSSTSSYDTRAKPTVAISRGTIIPQLLRCTSTHDAGLHFRQLRAQDFSPFRLLVLSLHSAIDFVWEGQQLLESPVDLTKPFMVASSSLGDALVIPPRQKQFDSTVAKDPTPEVQDAFHDWKSPQAGFESALMQRPDARTVSQAVVHLSQTHVKMRVALLDDQLLQMPFSDEHTLELHNH